MTLTVNGQASQVPDGLTIQGLLQHLGVTATRVAVEVNLQIVKRDKHPEHRLCDGDKVEIVTFVGGG
jgi:sulfur carrier protein